MALEEFGESTNAAANLIGDRRPVNPLNQVTK
jgi:hypothetical protein